MLMTGNIASTICMPRHIFRGNVQANVQETSDLACNG